MANKRDNKVYGVYVPSVLSSKVSLHITEVGQNLKTSLQNVISQKNEGKCIVEGYIKPNSVKVINYSSGVVCGEMITFETMYECMVSHPVEGMLIECEAKTITKAGIHAEVVDDEGNVPITVFIARDHHYTQSYFNNVKENEQIKVSVIGIRFELNDPYICAITKLVDNRNISDINYDRTRKEPINIINDDQ
jgi:DNA-directed RNA polymerase subunit E'/Rpb7